MPESIKKFGDIPLRDYNKAGPCSKPNGYFRKSYKGTLKEKLFQQYAENVQTMMANTETNQKALLGIIDQLFVFIKDPQDPNKKLIVINPKLDNKLLSKLVADTRNLIIKLYATCEQDFFKGLQIFEALVEKQILDASTAQIKQLQQNVEETISIEGTPPALPPSSSGGPSVPPPPPGSPASGPMSSAPASGLPAGAPVGGPAGATGPPGSPGGLFSGLFGRRGASSTTGATSGTPASTTGATSGTPASTTGATSGTPASTTGATSGSAASSRGATSGSATSSSTIGSTSIPSSISVGDNSTISPLTDIPTVSSRTENISTPSMASETSSKYTGSGIQSAPEQLEGNEPSLISLDSSEGIPGAPQAQGPTSTRTI
jgi:hypothetical protein